MQILSLAKAQYLSLLSSNPLEWDELWDDYGGDPNDSFFRYPTQFELLTRLISEKATTASHRTLKVLSVGCAMGFEPYSLSMALAGTALPALGWDISVFACDISEESLNKARNAIFSQQDLYVLNPSMAKRWFRPRAAGRQFKSELAPKVQFFKANPNDLVSGPLADLIGSFDVVFARGLSFDCPDRHVSSFAGGLLSLLAHDGYLFTAPGEIWPVGNKTRLEERDGIAYIHKNVEKIKSNIFHTSKNPRRKPKAAQQTDIDSALFQRKAVLEKRFAELLDEDPDQGRDVVLEMLQLELERGCMTVETLKLMVKVENRLDRSQCAFFLESFMEAWGGSAD
jgi:chemotaxis methyl-accepting protein methylase